jgi:type IX secretion system PorP/SprF family membrane protein
MKKLVLLVMLAMITGFSYAQDPEFSQFFASPLYLNPAFAGSVRCPRIVLNYRDQWPNMPGTFVTYAVSYDQYVSSFNGGLGLLVWKDDAGSGTMKTTNISGIYAYQLNVNREFTINAGFQASYMQKSLDWSKLTFGDQIDPRYGFVYTTQEIQNRSSNSFLDLSAGVVGYTSEFYGGIAVNHLTQPSEGFIVMTTPLPMKITAHIGAYIPLDDSRRNSSFISPNLLVQFQQSFQQYNFGLYVAHGPLTGGLWYRFSPTNGDAIIAMVGLQADMFKFGYSYDITVSGLANYSGGAHEVSLGYQFDCHPRKRRFHTLKCPAF